MIMVGGISFISTTDDGGAAPADGEGGEIPGQSGASCVIPLIRAQPQTDDYRTLEERTKDSAYLMPSIISFS